MTRSASNFSSNNSISLNSINTSSGNVITTFGYPGANNFPSSSSTKVFQLKERPKKGQIYPRT